MKKHILLTVISSMLISFIVATTAMAESGGRSEGQWGVTGEAAWNGLGGVGPQVHYLVTDSIPVDIGLGIGATGVKAGLRGRYLFRPDSKLTPFIGLGMSYGLGSGDEKVDFENDDDDHEIKIKSSPFAQLTCGLDYQASNGFMIMASAGWAQLLRDDNVEKVSGVFDADDDDVLDAAFGSGIIAAINIGYAF